MSGDESGSNEEAPLAVTVTIDSTVHHQTLEGFGASLAYYEGWLVEHPNKAEIYPLIFADLGLDIIRLRNRYQGEPGDFHPEAQELVREAQASLGHSPVVLMSSWSPPASLKANGSAVCRGEDSCTLRRAGGAFMYEQFGQYWFDSLEAYASIGIVPRFISIQNEPDFIPPSWEGCRFQATEQADYPSYGRALDAVDARLSELASRPDVLGPETATVENGRLDNYTAGLDLSKLYGVAHHLYGSDGWRVPDSYAASMRGIAQAYPDMARFQTEFSITDPVQGAFETAWIIHNALVEEEANAYLYWDLVSLFAEAPIILPPRSIATVVVRH